MARRPLTALLAAAAITAFAGAPAQANSVYLTPANQVVDLAAGSTLLTLWMDFSEATLGGGIDIEVTGPLEFTAFTPSAAFSGFDPFFSGHGKTSGAFATSKDYLVYWGDFLGLSGKEELGTVELGLTGPGVGAVALSINADAGAFISATDFSSELSVDLVGAAIEVTAVPLPAALWMLAGGLGLLTWLRRRA